MRRRRSRSGTGNLAFLASSLSVLLAAALLFQLAQAGQSYLYCRAMQATISHPCCANGGGGVTTQPCAHAVAAPSSDCCQLRKVPALAACTASTPSALPTAPLVAVAYPLPAANDLAFGIAPRRDRSAPRTGPPPTRARAQFMVFLI